MKKAFKIMLTAAVIIILAAVMAVTVLAEDAEDHGGVKQSGTCGQYVSYTWYNDGYVEITGTGEMVDYENSNYSEEGAPPWHYYVKKIPTGTWAGGYYTNSFYPFQNITNITQI